MTRDVNAIGEPAPLGIFPRQAPVRADNERQGGGGQGHGQPREKEPEKDASPEEPPEETGHLEEDSFRAKRPGADLAQFMADKLPWEVNEGGAKNPLEQSRLALPHPAATPAQSLPPKAAGTFGMPQTPLHRLNVPSDQPTSAHAPVPFPPRPAQLATPPSPRGTKPLEPAPLLERPAPQAPVIAVYCACAYRVLDGATGRPVGGARLEFSPLRDEGPKPFSVQADVAGLFNSSRVLEGNYRVRAVLEGYEPQTQTRCLSPDEEDSGTFLIQRIV